jgi:hypothetical protein
MENITIDIGILIKELSVNSIGLPEQDLNKLIKDRIDACMEIIKH